MRTLGDSLNERMKNESFRREYGAIQPEMNVIRVLIEARRERSMTQADLAARTGIDLQIALVTTINQAGLRYFIP